MPSLVNRRPPADQDLPTQAMADLVRAAARPAELLPEEDTAEAEPG